MKTSYFDYETYFNATTKGYTLFMKGTDKDIYQSTDSTATDMKLIMIPHEDNRDWHTKPIEHFELNTPLQIRMFKKVVKHSDKADTIKHDFKMNIANGHKFRNQFFEFAKIVGKRLIVG